MLFYLCALYFLSIACQTSESCKNSEEKMNVSPTPSSAHIPVETDADKIILENANLRAALKNAEERIIALEVTIFSQFFVVTYLFI